jgi:hypothetical protein
MVYVAIFYTAGVLTMCVAVVASALFPAVAAADGEEEEETGTKPSTSGSSGSGKKTYKSAYHHVRPGHSGNSEYHTSSQPTQRFLNQLTTPSGVPGIWGIIGGGKFVTQVFQQRSHTRISRS